MTERGRTPRRALDAVGFLGWVTVVAFLTLSPVEVRPDAETLAFLCVACGQRGMADAALNFLFFVPGGFLASRLVGHWRALALAVVATAGIETLQWLIPGRYPSLSDIIFNSGGALAGSVLAAPRRRTVALRLAPLLAATSWLLPLALVNPVEPGQELYGQWSPVVGGMEPYSGTVLAAEVDGQSVPSWRLDDPGRVTPLWRGGTLELTLSGGPPPNHLAAVFSIADASGGRLLVIAALEDDIAVHRRTVAAALRLEQPLQWFDGALGGMSPGDTARLAFRVSGNAGCLTSARTSTCQRPPGPSRGWQFLMGSRLEPGGRQTTLSVLWTLAVGALLGAGLGSFTRGIVAALVLAVTAPILSWPAWDADPQALWGALLVLAGGVGGWVASGPLLAWTVAPSRVADAPARGQHGPFERG